MTTKLVEIGTVANPITLRNVKDVPDEARRGKVHQCSGCFALVVCTPKTDVFVIPNPSAPRALLCISCVKQTYERNGARVVVTPGVERRRKGRA